MAIQDITKPMALDETLQATNQALGGVAKDTSLQATNTALGLLGKDATLQSIVTALASIGLNTVGNLAQLTTEQKTSLVAAINELMAGKVPNSAIGVANGVAELDANGLVPSSQIPDAVDEIIEGYLYNGTFYEDSAHTKPITGKTGKIYVDLSTEKTYRWGGSAYVEISASLALGETSSTAYRGDRGKTAYDHSQDASRVTSAIVEGLYKVGATAQGHISSMSAVQKSDITALGIPGQDTTYNDATQSVRGLMSASDKTKLDGISTGANKVEDSSTNGNIKIDNVETQVYDDSDIQAKLSTALTPISGNPISISGLKSTQLAVEPVITFEPIQAGSGTPSPENIRPISGYDKIEVLSYGKNLFDKSKVELGKISTITGEDESASDIYRYKDYIYLKSNTRYTIGSTNGQTVRIYYYSDNAYIGTDTFSSATSIDTGNSIKRIRFQSREFQTVKEILQIEEGATATTYAPYHKTTDLSYELPETVCGGSLDVRTGKLINNRNIVNDLSLGTWTLYATNSFYSDSFTSRFSNTYNGICSVYKNCGASIGNIENYGFVGDANGRIYMKNEDYSDATAFKNSLANVQFCAPKKAYTTIQLTPRGISLLEQYAYVSTNGTTIALSYHQGEMASLSDVSQLGETVNELGGAYPITLFEVAIAGKTISSYYGEISTSIDINKYVPIAIADGSKWDEKCNYSWGYGSSNDIRIHIKCTEASHTIGSDRSPLLVYCIPRKRVTT